MPGWDIPAELAIDQLWGSTVQAPVQRWQLVGVDLPEEYSRTWRIDLSPLQPRVAGSVPIQLSGSLLDRDTTFATIQYGDHRGGGQMTELDFTWPAQGAAFDVYGSQVRLWVSYQNTLGSPLPGDPIYTARVSPAWGGLTTRRQGWCTAPYLTFPFLQVAPAGTAVIGPGSLSPRRQRFPARATHVRVSTEGFALPRLLRYTMSWDCVGVSPSIGSSARVELQRIGDPAQTGTRNHFSADGTSMLHPIPSPADRLTVSWDDAATDGNVFITFYLEP